MRVDLIGARNIPFPAEITINTDFPYARFANPESFDEDEFTISAVIISPDGSAKIMSEDTGWKGDELKVIGSLVEDLFEKGGGEIMEMYRDIPEE